MPTLELWQNLPLKVLVEPQIYFFMVFQVLYPPAPPKNAIVWQLSVFNLNHRQLYTHICFFLVVLSTLENCYSMSIIPQMLFRLCDQEEAISIPGCATQLFCLSFGVNGCFLLTALEYDYQVAILNPHS